MHNGEKKPGRNGMLEPFKLPTGKKVWRRLFPEYKLQEAKRKGKGRRPGGLGTPSSRLRTGLPTKDRKGVNIVDFEIATITQDRQPRDPTKKRILVSPTEDTGKNSFFRVNKRLLKKMTPKKIRAAWLSPQQGGWVHIKERWPGHSWDAGRLVGDEEKRNSFLDRIIQKEGRVKTGCYLEGVRGLWSSHCIHKWKSVRGSAGRGVIQGPRGGEKGELIGDLPG